MRRRTGCQTARTAGRVANYEQVCQTIGSGGRIGTFVLIIVGMLVVGSVAGCGQRGPLTLPARSAESADVGTVGTQTADDEQSMDEERTTDREERKPGD